MYRKMLISMYVYKYMHVYVHYVSMYDYIYAYQYVTLFTGVKEGFIYTNAYKHICVKCVYRLLDISSCSSL
jgi:hypothetical protein